MHDAIIIGSGFGGALAAHALVRAGRRVLLLERGRWVERGPDNWLPGSAAQLSEHYSTATPYEVEDDAGRSTTGGFFCVGGPSVFYGGVSLRFREQDFERSAEVAGDSGAEWPYGYAELEPYYTRVEQLIGVAGTSGEDPTEPWRSAPFPQAPPPLAPVSIRIRDAARSLGLNPFRLPVAINYGAEGRTTCTLCPTCDGFACAISAKNDLATAILPPLLRDGLEVRTEAVAARLAHDGRRITGVEYVHAATGERTTVAAAEVILAAGTLATPHLLMASGLDSVTPAPEALGGYLMRHCNRIVLGFFRRRPDPEGRFHKHLAIHDLYFGDPSGEGPRERLGGLQQLVTPPVSLVRAQVPRLLGPLAALVVPQTTGLLAIAEDQPRLENRVSIDASRSDSFGMPVLRIRHRYTERDEAAVRTLAKTARRVLRRAGALAFYNHHIATFSHALGTVRMGRDPRTSPLDGECRFRGIDNLLVVDGSALPTSAGVNPSLTIAANALRAAEALAAR
jgi:choline dehydrogenase-like flavoprotein